MLINRSNIYQKTTNVPCDNGIVFIDYVLGSKEEMDYHDFLLEAISLIDKPPFYISKTRMQYMAIDMQDIIGNDIALEELLNISNSQKILSSINIKNSYNITKSNEIANSKYLSNCELLKNSYFCYKCRGSNNLLFCNNLVSKINGFYFDNHRVTEKKFNEIKENLEALLLKKEKSLIVNYITNLSNYSLEAKNEALKLLNEEVTWNK